jgi:uncharacterized protein (TIRG00374 family)
MRDILRTVLKVIISGGLMAWTFSRVPFAEVSQQIAAARPAYLLGGLLVFLVAIVADGTKWLVLLRAQEVRVPWATVLKLQFVGFFFNNFLPSANLGGDVVRGFGLARLTEQPARAAVSVLVDRIMGLLAYMSSGVVASVLAVNVLGRHELRPVQSFALLATLAVGVGLGLLLSRRLRGLIARLLTWHPLAPLARHWSLLSEAFDAYRLGSRALRAAFSIALLGMLCTGLVNRLVSQAMGGQMPLPIIFLFNPLIALTLMLPISIGGLGVSQAAYPFFYGMADVSAEHALAVSLLVQVTQLVASLPGGLFWLRARTGPVPQESTL